MGTATISQPVGGPASEPVDAKPAATEEPAASAEASSPAPATTASTSTVGAAVSVPPATGTEETESAAETSATAAATTAAQLDGATTTAAQTAAASSAVPTAETHPQGALVVPLPWPKRKLAPMEVRLCIAAIVCWIVLLGAGVTVGTKKYIDLIDGPASVGFFTSLTAWFWILTCYTVTNVGILCCLAALIGAIGQSTQIDEADKALAKTDLRTLYVSAMIRAFFIYVAVLSGAIMFTDTPQFTDISLERYLKLAGLVSALSFAIGYNPGLFASFFSRVSRIADGSGGRAG